MHNLEGCRFIMPIAYCMQLADCLKCCCHLAARLSACCLWLQFDCNPDSGPATTAGDRHPKQPL